MPNLRFKSEGSQVPGEYGLREEGNVEIFTDGFWGYSQERGWITGTRRVDPEGHF